MKLPEGGINDAETWEKYKNIFLNIKWAFVGVMNEYC
jgi:hypothetical protein